ncbi:MAG: hypothetical protein Tsb0020_22980 [Haliangiales bacterium]
MLPAGAAFASDDGGAAAAGAVAAVSASDKLDEAQELRAQGRYRDAVTAIEAGLAVEPDHRVLRRVHVITLTESRRYADALAACATYMDLVRVGPNRRQMRQLCRDLKSAVDTKLSVEVTNGPAEVYLDFETLGVRCVAAPACTQSTMPGKPRLIVKRDGFKPWKRRVRMRKGRTKTVAVTLEELPSAARLVVEPAAAGVEVTLDGAPLEGDLGDFEVAPGEHKLEIQAPGYADHREEFVAREGKPVELTVRLDELVRVVVSPADARLAIDGQAVDGEARLAAQLNAQPSADAEPTGEAAAAEEPEGATAAKPGVASTGEPRPTAASERGAGAVSEDSGADHAVWTLRLPSERSEHQLTVRADGYHEREVTIPRERPLHHQVTVALALIPPPPPPSLTPSEWTPTKVTLVATAGAAVLASVGLTANLAQDARARYRRMRADCRSDDGPGLLCGDIGAAEGERFERSLANTEWSAMVTTLSTVAALTALGINDSEAARGQLSTRRTLLAGAVTAIGLSGMGLGGLGFWRARSAGASLSVTCGDDERCARLHHIYEATERRQRRLGVIGLSVAGASALAVTYLSWPLIAPDAAPIGTIEVVPSLSGDQAGVHISGRF